MISSVRQPNCWRPDSRLAGSLGRPQDRTTLSFRLSPRSESLDVNDHLDTIQPCQSTELLSQQFPAGRTKEPIAHQDNLFISGYQSNGTVRGLLWILNGNTGLLEEKNIKGTEIQWPRWRIYGSASATLRCLRLFLGAAGQEALDIQTSLKHQPSAAKQHPEHRTTLETASLTRSNKASLSEKGKACETKETWHSDYEDGV